MIPVQCRMARIALNLSVVGLSRLAGVSSNTVVRFERGEILKRGTVAQIQLALESAGVEFIPETGGKGAGVRLAKSSGTSTSGTTE